MHKRVVWMHPTKSNLVLLNPAYDGQARRNFQSDEALLEHVVNHDMLLNPNYTPGTPYHLVDEEAFPADDSFVDAWEVSGEKVVINLSKARDIHMNRIRRVRDLELAKLDVPFMRALEVGDTIEQDRITAEKQVLRDIPQTFSLAAYRSPITLNAAWPEGLPRPTQE